MTELSEFLSGRHPYYPSLGEVVVPMLYYVALPGTEVPYLAVARQTARMSAGSWTALAGPFVLGGEGSQVATDRRLLLGLLWDLLGMPICAGAARRPAATFVVVWPRGGSATVYRSTREMRCSTGEDESRIRTVHSLTVRADVVAM